MTDPVRTLPSVCRSGVHGRLSAPVWLGIGQDEETGAARSVATVAAALAACVVLGALVFAGDLMVRLGESGPPGMAIPILYLAVLVPCRWLPWRHALPAVAVVAAVLTGLAGLAGSVTAAEIVNRFLFVAAIGAGAFMMHRCQALETASVRAQAEAERASRSTSRFLASAGHDLRHPIQAGLLFHDLLGRRLRGTPHAELAANLGLSFKAMQELVDGLLEMSRLDSGRIVPRRVDLPVSTVLESLADRFTPAAKTSGVVLRVVGCGAVIRTDPELIMRLLEGLLANAVKYTNNGRVLLGCRRRGRLLGIQIWDTGIGIPSEHLRDIFEEFQQLRTAGGEAGQGLGLSRVKRLGRLLHHPIGVRSAVGCGSMFEVVVPLVR